MKRAFTPQQQVQIAFLAGRYATAEEIAGTPKINCHPSEVAAFLSFMDLPAAPNMYVKAHIRCEIERDLIPVLDLAASARRVGRNEMAEKLLTKALAYNLVGAVMEDGL